jgi:pimeloyl-ACP methyl ester carboxylesterase
VSAAPLFALPGTLLDARSLAPLLMGLAAETLILGDAAQLDEEVDRLAAQTSVPAIWLGHSLGGILALQLARRHPHKVAGLVLLASNARAGRDTNEAARSAQWALAKNAGLGALVREVLVHAYGLADEEQMLCASLIDQAEAVGLRRFSNQLSYASQRPGLLAPRQALTAPVLILSGQCDAICPPICGEEIAALVEVPGGARHLVLPHAGHLFPLQQASAVAQPLRRFLQALEESPP